MNERTLFLAIDNCDDEFINEVILEKMDSSRRAFVGYKRPMHVLARAAAVALVCILLLGTGVAVAAAVSDEFRDYLYGIFGAGAVTEIPENEVAEPEGADSEKTISKTDGTELTWDDETGVVGVHETFIEKYHLTDDENADIIVDRVYTVQGDEVVPLEERNFSADCDGDKIAFSYVTVGDEIVATRTDVGKDQWISAFHHIDDGRVILEVGFTEGDSVTRAYLAEADLEAQTVKKISGDKMICNFLMSPDGKYILCNHRSDEYWSVFDVREHTEKKVDGINPYAHTSEITFIDNEHILTLGDSTSYQDADGEWTESWKTNYIDLKTGETEAVYDGVGDVGQEWQLTSDRGKLSLKSIVTGRVIEVEEGDETAHLLAENGDYAILGCYEEGDAFYIVRLSTGSVREVDIPKQFREDVYLNVAANAEKLVITKGDKAYLVDIAGM